MTEPRGADEGQGDEPASKTDTADRQDAAAKESSKKDGGSFWRELPILILVALVLSFVIQTFIARVYLIPSESMQPTLHGCPGCTGDRILVEKVSYRFSDPRPGDVLVFRGTGPWAEDYVSTRSENVVVRGLQEIGSAVGIVPPDENDLVKRVIAVGGQTVECCDDDGSVLVDGRPVDEPYVVSDFPYTPGQIDCDTDVRSGRCFGPVRIPEDHIWMMGDNRNQSKDSRWYVGDESDGAVPVENVVGKARWIILPPARWGSISAPEIQEPVASRE
ncbi:signal peptidase I [Hoyosella altamirensis]|uniref:Signal peptidase I n=1 Tax=Hoyosella altamirensis TaxID=616997 RepID=A0A839RQ06_9ACTN|nr:signal peptidase I [Hoyosella altamirensis]MBB3038620.1 signal peptidase I [Hoyosella altamirensis]